MLSLLRRDPIIGTIAVVKGGILALNAGVMAGLVVTLAGRADSRVVGNMAGNLFLAGLIWFSVVPFLLFGKALQRCHLMDLGLPIPARRIWLAHVLALLLQGLVFLALILGTLWMLLWMVRSALVDFSLLKQALAGMFLRIPACLVLIVVLLQRIQAARFQSPRSHAGKAYSILLLFAGFALVVFLAGLPVSVAFVPLGVAWILGYRTYGSLPPVLTWTPAELHPGIGFPYGARDAEILRATEAREWEMCAGRSPMRGLGLGWFLVRVFCLNPARNRFAALFFFPVYFLWGILLSGFLAAWRDMELPQLTYTVLTGYLLMSFLPAQLQQLPNIDFLPISRKLLAAFLFIPPFLSFAAGLGIGAIGAALLERSQPQLQLRTSASSYIPPYETQAPMVRVPPEYCAISWGGDPPDVVSPWGESHPVWKYPLFGGSRIMVYSPFSTPAGSSAEYVAFQISRAIERIYGASVPYREILDRYLVVSEDGTIVLEDSTRLLADHPEWQKRGNIALAPFLLAVIGVVFAIMSSIYLRTCRAGASETRRKAVFMAIAIAAIGITVAQIGLVIARWVRIDVASAFLRILMLGAVQSIPGGTPTLWMICMLMLAGVYGFCRGRFLRVEALPGQTGRSCM